MKPGYYWFTSERSSYKSVGQYVNGRWYLVGEAEAFTLEQINQRGWDLGDYIAGQELE